MFFLGALCLVATAVALPVLPEAPILPASAIIVLEKELHTNVPKIIEVAPKKDDSKEEAQDEVVLRSLPAAPELPPLDETILKNLKIIKDKSIDEIIKPESEKSEDVEENPKEEEPKKDASKESEKDDVTVTIDEVKEKPLKESKKPIIVTWKIPTAPFLSNIVSSFPFHFSPISNIWPLRATSVLNHPRIVYPGYIEDQI